jgi:hypothetical protein
MRDARKAYAQGRARRMLEASKGGCARLGWSDARGKAGWIREERQGGCERQGKADALCNQGRCAMQGRADARGKLEQMVDAK